MFQTSRSPFHRPHLHLLHHAGPVAEAPRPTVSRVSAMSARHPAMRGLDISPVHGRHCICGRCEQMRRQQHQPLAA
jgi:hypothetical protein